MHLAVLTLMAATTLSYGEDPKQRVDVYAPPSDARGVAVFLHGGVWQFGDRTDYVHVGEAFAKQGFVAFVASYRLAPRHVWPAQIEDAKAIASLALDEAKKRGKPLILIGHSAGAQLAALLAYDERYLGERRQEIAALALLSGVFDLRAPLDDARPDGGFAQFVAPAFGRDPPKDASPISFTSKLDVRILLVTSERDYSAMRKQTFTMQRALSSRKERVEVIDVKGVDHFGIVGQLGTRADPVLPRIVSMITAW